MKTLRRILNLTAGFLFLNQIFFFSIAGFLPLFLILSSILLVIWYVHFVIKPIKNVSGDKALGILIGGCETSVTAAILLCAELFLYLFTIYIADTGAGNAVMAFNAVFAGIFLFLFFLAATARLLVSSRQIPVRLKVFLLIFWWVPLLNIILILRCANISKKEYADESEKLMLNEARKDDQVCQTKYPILLVHGIFFRDWGVFNYWGRIPKELKKNGARIYYGDQESALSIEDSAVQIKDKILEILKKESCEKVNIIAHSKGGLDSRYAISALGMDKHVASLTTVNTPHCGCNFTDKLMEGKHSRKLVKYTTNKYNSFFKILGDESPDFYSGVNELTAQKCSELNAIMPNMDNVYYQSVGSIMRSRKSAGFPLSLSYPIIKRIDGDNDGLVCTESMKWGHFLGIKIAGGKSGISHADMVDMTRRNIKGFDVREFYVGIVSKLREMNF